jgi:8-oxo-dGTP diphosphatase
MAFCYDYPHPAVTADVVVFTVREERLAVLLIQRAQAPYAHYWALPGGFIEPDENLEQGALRELFEETGLTNVYLEQLYTFGKPDRDPRERIISVAYIALGPIERLAPVAASDATAVGWFDLDDLPPLAFDHQDILHLAHQRLRAKLDYSTLAFHLLETSFTFGELQQVYELIRGTTIDKRNFRKLMHALNWLEETGKTRRVGQHKPAKLYRLAVSSPLNPIR